jgi:hypothetical protein
MFAKISFSPNKSILESWDERWPTSKILYVQDSAIVFETEGSGVLMDLVKHCHSRDITFTLITSYRVELLLPDIETAAMDISLPDPIMWDNLRSIDIARFF